MNNTPFLDVWHLSMMIGAVIMFVVSISVYVVHRVRVAVIKDPKVKYDFLSLKEVKHLKNAVLCLAISVMLVINLYGMNNIDKMGIWFFVRLFISVAGGTCVGYVTFLVLDYYYPTVLHQKLNKLRYQTRINEATGHEMRLLTEEEEDVHLEEGMKAEEDVFSVDYDVWVDDKTGEVKIEKYPGHLQALKCNNCGFHTMKIVKEEITQQPTELKAGELIKNYQCTYCKSVRATAFKISTRDTEDYKQIAQQPKKHTEIDLIRIEISGKNGKEYYEFETPSQAKKFLGEYAD